MLVPTVLYAVCPSSYNHRSESSDCISPAGNCEESSAIDEQYCIQVQVLYSPHSRVEGYFPKNSIQTNIDFITGITCTVVEFEQKYPLAK